MNRTKIHYLDFTWGPTKGCDNDICSPGCKNCWARVMAKRLAGMGVNGYDKDNPFRVETFPERLMQPFKEKKPSRIGVSFMGDLFHPNVGYSFLRMVFWNMLDADIHTYFLLTKRPENMVRFIQKWLTDDLYIPPNIWTGATICNQSEVWKVDTLIKAGLPNIWLSVEPMLSEIRIPEEQLREISWVVVGCESGPGRRPAKEDWFRSLRDQCADTDTPFFLKQMEIGGKVVSMPELDGKIHAEMPK